MMVSTRVRSLSFRWYRGQDNGRNDSEPAQEPTILQGRCRPEAMAGVLEDRQNQSNVQSGSAEPDVNHLRQAPSSLQRVADAH